MRGTINSRRMQMIRRALIAGMCLTLLVAGQTALAEDAPKKPQTGTRLQQRIDFGNSYIMGQSIKSGAVYLLHRKQSEIDSMISIRTNYRKEIMEENGMPKIENETKAADESKRKTAPSGFKASTAVGNVAEKKK